MWPSRKDTGDAESLPNRSAIALCLHVLPIGLSMPFYASAKLALLTEIAVLIVQPAKIIRIQSNLLPDYCIGIIFSNASMLRHISMQEKSVRLDRPSTSGRFQGKDVILEYYRRYNAGDVDGVMELMAPDCQCKPTHPTSHPEIHPSSQRLSTS